MREGDGDKEWGGEQRVTMETGEAEAGLGQSEWAGGGGKR